MDDSQEHHLQTKNSDSPISYISFPSAKDPDWQKKHPGTATIQVIGSFPYNWMKQWEEKKWQKRGVEYEKVKEEIKNKLLEKIVDRVNENKELTTLWKMNNVVAIEASTGLSFQRFTSNIISINSFGESGKYLDLYKHFNINKIRCIFMCCFH